MVKGINVFKKYFKDYSEQYVFIGGTACDLLMESAGMEFRATKDLDLVLIVEALTESFVEAFWQFIMDGGYSLKQQSNGKPQFYRFSKPSSPDFPEMIELFSKKPNMKLINDEAILTPLHVSDEVSSLSAILLDSDYYEFLLDGIIYIDQLPILNYTHLIPFKAKAWMDMKTRKAQGANIDSKNITKHKKDIFRLFSLLSPDLRIRLSSTVLNDLNNFVNQMQTEDIDLKQLGLRNLSLMQVLETVVQIYDLKKD